jgi:hypothetical protein
MDKIKLSIIHYDFSRHEFDQKFKKINSVKFVDSQTDLNSSVVIINNIKFKYNIIGRHDKITSVWEWGWLNKEAKNKTYDLRTLFLYGIDNYDQEFNVINNLLINSKIKINNDMNIDILLAITLRFLTGLGYKYIFPFKENNSITRFLILKPDN